MLFARLPSSSPALVDFFFAPPLLDWDSVAISFVGVAENSDSNAFLSVVCKSQLPADAHTVFSTFSCQPTLRWGAGRRSGIIVDSLTSGMASQCTVIKFDCLRFG
jgi:hypothetical protein